MSDLISREDALRWTNPIDWDTPDERWRPESEYGRYIQSLPSADVKPIVRCKDCVYCKAYNDIWYLPKEDALVCVNSETEVNADDYCSWGERKK